MKKAKQSKPKKFNPTLSNNARCLRQRTTLAENMLWKYLRNNQLSGCRFRRQQPIGNYIVDFVCLEKKLVIEIDGGQHMEDANKDKARDQQLRKEGFRVLRFWNNEVTTNIEGVYQAISNNIGE